MTRLELIRRTRGLSQKEVARMAGVAPTILSHVERRRRECYPKLRGKLCQIFGMEENYLFDSLGMALEIETDVRQLA